MWDIGSDHGGENGGPFIYDPSGSYKVETRGNLPYLEDKEADRNDYLNKQKEGGEEVEIFAFPTTEIEERAVANYIRKLGNDPRGFNCAKFVSNAISEFGPFKNVTGTKFPANLAEQLRKILKK